VLRGDKSETFEYKKDPLGFAFGSKETRSGELFLHVYFHLILYWMMIGMNGLSSFSIRTIFRKNLGFYPEIA